VLQFHQNGKGYRRGQRIEVTGEPLPLDHAERFSVFHAGAEALAAGDTVRVTQNSFTKDGLHRLYNGALYRVNGFGRDGTIVLENGWVVGKDFGHLAHGAVVTSYGSQGKTVDRVLIGQSAMSFPASSREQFYVSCSRARESVTVYCDDKSSLRDAVAQSEDRTSATELVNSHRRRLMAVERQAELAHQRDVERFREVAYVR
jgi:ATP-dependent exoDNAse (exonuclease V) alpha subunit